ncbi:hypothetical protein TRAPUB_8792 [Trametes pubescens]|uniref:F-box domain-containing protein n=1 Tax=Trametes pubescens TaxID=154538 RepID=A0A1M2W809_TRAPU|nr:hypothetical protein TRAPUB_8792 [Trametes pubescens]
MTANTLSRIPQELFEHIFRLLMLEPCNSDGKMVGCRTVAYFARTCRYLHEPAVNVLWHTIPDIALLFFTLPREMCLVQHLIMLDEQDNCLEEKMFASMFASKPSEAMLARFFAYAHRVKAIHHRGCHLPPTVAVFSANPETYHALAVILQDRSLLPNVESIDFHRKAVVSTAVFRSFNILFGYSLKRLSIFSREGPVRDKAWLWRDPALGVEPQEEKDFQGMLAELTKRVPALEMLKLNMYPSSATMALTTSAALAESSFAYLTSLQLLDDCLPIRPDAFRSLGYLPNLHVLEFSSNIVFWTFWTDVDFAGLAAENHLFPVLRKLSITGTTSAVPTKLLGWVSSPTLALLTIYTDDDVLRSDIDPLIAAIAAMPSRDSLSALNVCIPDVMHEAVSTNTALLACYNANARCRPSRRRARAPEPLSRTTFEPLMKMHSLEEVMLDIHCPLDLDDALLESFGLAWPKLRLLNLGAPSPWGTFVTDVRVGEVHDFPPFVVRQLAPPQDGAGDDSDSDGDEEFDDIEMMGAWSHPRVTLLGLLAFAAHVPFLAELGLDSFDATLAAVPLARLEQRPARGVVHGALRTLHVGLSPIENPWAVAAVLSDAFPGLVEVDCLWKLLEEDDEDDVDRDGPERAWWSLQKRYGTRWERVGELVQKFVKVRSHERTRKRKAAYVCPSVDMPMQEAYQ